MFQPMGGAPSPGQAALSLGPGSNLVHGDNWLKENLTTVDAS